MTTVPRPSAVDTAAFIADPDLWLEDRAAQSVWPLVPFSAGPAVCAGRNLVLLTAGSMLANLIVTGAPRETSGALSVGQPLPRALNPFGLRLELA